jgi:hypothetical protein
MKIFRENRILVFGLSKVKNTGDGKKARVPSSDYIRYLAEERRFYGE